MLIIAAGLYHHDGNFVKGFTVDCVTPFEK